MRFPLATLAVLFLLGVALYAGAQGGAAGLTRIGAAAAVSGLVKATAPGAVGRVMSSGKPVFLNDRVTSDASGKMQVMLLDETVFTLGPNADMVLDEFVYDPNTSAGKVTARITKGAFRFVTGKIARQNPDTMKVKLAVGTIGIRGTVVVGATGQEGSIVINAGAGAGNNADEPPSALFLENEGQTVDIDQTGQGSSVKPGQPPSAPKDMSQELGKIVGALESQPKDKSNGGKAGGEDAGKESGQDSAKGKDGSLGAEEFGDAAEDASQSLALAVQEASELATKSTWESIRANVPSGAGFYSATGDFKQTRMGSIPVDIDGTWGFDLSVDFGARTITGDISANTSSNGGNINVVNQPITGVSFASLSGLATFNSSTSPGTYNATFQFIDLPSQVAGQLEGKSTYNFAGSDIGASVGTATAVRQ